MSSSALVQAVREGTTAPDDPVRAQADVDLIERLVGEALAISEATAGSRARFEQIVQDVERLIQPWRMSFAVVGLVRWHEDLRRQLLAQALAVFGRSGALLCHLPTEELGPGGPGVLPSLRFMRWGR